MTAEILISRSFQCTAREREGEFEHALPEPHGQHELSRGRKACQLHERTTPKAGPLSLRTVVSHMHKTPIVSPPVVFIRDARRYGGNGVERSVVGVVTGRGCCVLHLHYCLIRGHMQRGCSAV
jgi:hypothetical protein